jgi:hypothetical protein
MSQENKAIVIRWFEEYWEKGNVAVVDHRGRDFASAAGLRSLAGWVFGQCALL